MAHFLEKNTISMPKRQELIKSFPCFATLTSAQNEELANLFQEVAYFAEEKIVTEDDLVDSVYLIVQGEAEVTKDTKSQREKKIEQTPIATLNAGEAIGLNDTGFYSSTGKRTATVTAITNMLLLRLDIKDLYGFLKKNNLELSMYTSALQMLRMLFIKQSLPFAKLSHERLHWLAERVEEISFPAGSIIFKQGDVGDKCYLIRKGEIEILIQDEENNHDRQIAVLKPPQLFGEATLITNELRNATARTVTDADVFVLRHDHLSELIESENNVAAMFMTLMVDRSRPIRNPQVTEHQRMTSDNQEITILKNPQKGSYFKLSHEGLFIWQSLDGKHTLQDITLNLAENYHVFAPEIVAALISKLTKEGFISNLEVQEDAMLAEKPLWIKTMLSIKSFLEKRVAFGDADRFITRTYNKYIRYLFTIPAQIILAILAITGIIAFSVYTPNVLLFFSFKHASLFLVLSLIPLSIASALLHELGHAYTVKAFGREIHYIGVGWYWFTPIAFVDTSDMWLATRKPRILVNLAGIYVNVLIAGICALLILLIENPYLQAILWLFALYSYISAFRMLSPLQEMDGYYVLMDWVEKTRLRQAAVLWLVKTLPKSIRDPQLFRKHLPEIYYWIACIIFLILVSVLTLILQAFIFEAFEIKVNPYISLILPFAVVIFSSFSILVDIRHKREE